MKPDIQRELIPRATTLHLIDALNAVRGKLSGGVRAMGAAGRHRSRPGLAAPHRASPARHRRTGSRP